MNGRRWKRIALLTALGVMLVVVGVLVWPEPKEARADGYVTFTVTLDWNGFDHSDCHMHLVQKDCMGGVIADDDFIPDGNYETWSLTNWPIYTETNCAVIFWDVGVGGEWFWLDDVTFAVVPAYVYFTPIVGPINRSATAH